jgi:hypothetical protein
MAYELSMTGAQIDAALAKAESILPDVAAMTQEQVDRLSLMLSPSASEPALTDLGEHTAFGIAASGAYACTAIGDSEITITAPQSGVLRAIMQVRALTVSTGCLASSYRAEDTGEGITAQAASFAGQLAAAPFLRTAQFLIGGVDVDATFAATLSDASATDDPITFDITGTAWHLVTVAYRATSGGTTLDWSLTQTNTSGTLLFSALPTSLPGAAGAATLTISSAAHTGRFDLDTQGPGGWLHAGRSSVDSLDIGPAGASVPSTLQTGGDVTTSTGPEVAFSGVSPATDYAATIAGVAGWSAIPGAGVAQLKISAFAGGAVVVEPVAIPAPIGDVIYPSADLTRDVADSRYSAQGHGHSDIASSVTAVDQHIQTHEATNVHVDRALVIVHVTPVGETLTDGQVIPFVWPISGYVTAIKAFSKAAPTTSPATFTVKAGAWGSTPAAVASAASIAAGAFSGSQTTITAAAVVKDQMGTITVAKDSGGTLADGIVMIEINPGDVVPGDPEDPEVEGRLVVVTWAFPSEDTIDRFEILRDGSPVYTTSTVTDRSATLFFYWDSLYTLRACLEDSCSEVADQIVAVFRPALAADGTATASSYRNTGGVDRVASAAIDGRSSTFWWGNETTGASWLMVDLGESKSITGYRLNMGSNRGTAWTAQASANGTDFTTVDTITTDQGHIYIKDGLSATGRYLRINFSAYSQNTGALVRELEVTGS